MSVRNAVIGKGYNPQPCYQVTEIDVTTPAETVLDLSLTYDYIAGAPGPNDPGPNLDRVVDHRDPSESRFYFYDELDRLWKAADLSGNPIHTYLYDANSNRTQQLGKERPWDALGGENCRHFSQAMFRHFLSTYGAPPRPPVAKNPPSPGR